MVVVSGKKRSEEIAGEGYIWGSKGLRSIPVIQGKNPQAKERLYRFVIIDFQ